MACGDGFRLLDGDGGGDNVGFWILDSVVGFRLRDNVGMGMGMMFGGDFGLWWLALYIMYR